MKYIDNLRTPPEEIVRSLLHNKNAKIPQYIKILSSNWFVPAMLAIMIGIIGYPIYLWMWTKSYNDHWDKVFNTSIVITMVVILILIPITLINARYRSIRKKQLNIDESYFSSFQHILNNFGISIIKIDKPLSISDKGALVPKSYGVIVHKTLVDVILYKKSDSHYIELTVNDIQLVDLDIIFSKENKNVDWLSPDSKKVYASISEKYKSLIVKINDCKMTISVCSDEEIIVEPTITLDGLEMITLLEKNILKILEIISLYTTLN